jgi:biotin carboxyl carrier protein
MKMETPVAAQRAGALTHCAAVGDMIAADAVIGRIG